MRSRGEVDIEKIARQHGGGGHRNAAGFTLDGGAASTNDAVAGILAEIEAALAEGAPEEIEKLGAPA